MNSGGNDKTNGTAKIFGMDPKLGRIVLSSLGLIAAYMVYSNLFSGPSSQATAPVSKGRVADAEADAGRNGAPSPGAPAQTAAPEIRRANPSARPKGEEFHPALRSKRKEEQVDVFALDPTLRLDLLAKVQDVKPDGGQRNLFQFGAMEPVAKLTGPEPVIAAPRPPMGPFPVKPPEPPPVIAVAPPPPIPFKYYGLSTKRVDGKKTAFFTDGEGDIILAPEGFVIKKRYRVVRIGATSVLMEDVDSKHQQSLPYIEDASVNAPG
jgi:hypothetical protein